MLSAVVGDGRSLMAIENECGSQVKVLNSVDLLTRYNSRVRGCNISPKSQYNSKLLLVTLTHFQWPLRTDYFRQGSVDQC